MGLRTAEPTLRRLIDVVAKLRGVPTFSYRDLTYSGPELLEAMVMAESSGNPRARRYEPHQDRPGRRDAAQDPDRPGVDDGDFEDDASYGLMQVMGYTAKGVLGLPPRTRLNYSFLYVPEVGLSFGVTVLMGEFAAVFREHSAASEPERVVRALCRYNGGPTGDDPVDDGEGAYDLRRRAYVERVASWSGRVKEDRIAAGWWRA